MTVLIQPIAGPQAIAWYRADIAPLIVFANLPDIQPTANREYSGLEALPHVYDSIVRHSLAQLGATTDEIALFVTPTRRNRPDWSSPDPAAMHIRSEMICVLFTTTAVSPTRMAQLKRIAYGDARKDTFLVPVKDKQAGHARRSQTDLPVKQPIYVGHYPIDAYPTLRDYLMDKPSPHFLTMPG